MQFNILTIVTLATVVATESLTDAINEFPSCSLSCLSDKVKDQGCQLTDFNCICKDELTIAIKLGTCTGSSCSGSFAGFDSGKALGNLCQRWHEDPSSTEVAAATSTLAAVVSAAPTATKNAAIGTDASIGFVGIAAAAALLI